MLYDFTAIPDEQVPQARDPLFQHLVATYAGETNKTAGVWRTITDDLMGYRPHEKTNNLRAMEVETARRVGGRRGKPVVLTVDDERMHGEGHQFFISANGVRLTEAVPPGYPSRM